MATQEPILKEPIVIATGDPETQKTKAIARMYAANDLANKRYADNGCVRIEVVIKASLTLDFFEDRPADDAGVRQILAEHLHAMIDEYGGLAEAIDSYTVYEAGEQ